MIIEEKWSVLQLFAERQPLLPWNGNVRSNSFIIALSHLIFSFYIEYKGWKPKEPYKGYKQQTVHENWTCSHMCKCSLSQL